MDDAIESRRQGQDADASKRLSTRESLTVLGIVAGLLLLWGLYAFAVVPWLAARLPSEGASAQAYGLSGDMFGGLNTLFAGLAFAFVAVAAYFQRQTMKAQREELEETRRQSALQAFEPLFFQLLHLFREQQSGAHVFMPPSWRYGGANSLLAHPEVEQLFRRIAQEAHVVAVASNNQGQGATTADALQKIQEIYGEVYVNNESTLGPMSRTLYHAMRLISKSRLDDQTQVRYANIARGLLGGEFLMLLMINCLCKPGTGFLPYVEHFGLLKHIRRDTPDEADQFMAGFFDDCAQMGHDERKRRWTSHPETAPELPA